MFKYRCLITISIIYVVLFFLITLWYSSKLEKNDKIPLLSSHRLAVIVPYRDRARELSLFLPHMHAFLNFQSIDHLFFIVHQIDTHRFNRAALINIGFLESRSLVDYIAMHDIDLLPINQQLPYAYPSNGPVHLASPQYHPIYNYSTYVGGILLISCEDFQRVNGMSPLYWGWGSEDDNLYVRMKLAQMRIYRPTNLSTDRTNTFRHEHDRQVRKRDGARYGRQKEENRKLHPEMGFNTTKYTIVNREKKKTEENDVEYILLNVKIECDYDRTPWCDH